MFENKLPSRVSVSRPLVNLLNPVQAVLRTDFAFIQTKEQISVEGKLCGKLSFIPKLAYSLVPRPNRTDQASLAACLRLGSVFPIRTTGDVMLDRALRTTGDDAG